MVVRVPALVALVALVALFGCGQSHAPTVGGGSEVPGASGGSAGSGGVSGSGGTAPRCLPASDDVSPDELGIHVRINGVANHFVRNVEAYLGPHDPDAALGFSVTAQKEASICGQLDLALTVISGSEEFDVGTYECAAAEPHEAAATRIMTHGDAIGLSYEGGRCSIEITQAGSSAGDDVAGTFSGVLGGADGELLVTDGSFRVTLTE